MAGTSGYCALVLCIGEKGWIRDGSGAAQSACAQLSSTMLYIERKEIERKGTDKKSREGVQNDRWTEKRKGIGLEIAARRASVLYYHRLHCWSVLSASLLASAVVTIQ